MVAQTIYQYFKALFDVLCTVDANESGPGKVEIKINDGQVPCNVENLGDRQYRASFKPEQAVQHVVQILFNDKEVNGNFICAVTIQLYETKKNKIIIKTIQGVSIRCSSETEM